MPRNQFLCSIDRDGNIRDMSDGYPGEIVGIDNQKADEQIEALEKENQKLRDKLNEWRPCMIEAGYLEPDPKTSEEIMQDTINKQNDTINALFDVVKSLKEEIINSKNNNIERIEEDGPVSNFTRSGESEYIENSQMGQNPRTGSKKVPKQRRTNSGAEQRPTDIGEGIVESIE